MVVLYLYYRKLLVYVGEVDRLRLLFTTLLITFANALLLVLYRGIYLILLFLFITSLIVNKVCAMGDAATIVADTLFGNEEANFFSDFVYVFDEGIE